MCWVVRNGLVKQMSDAQARQWAADFAIWGLGGLHWALGLSAATITRVRWKPEQSSIMNINPQGGVANSGQRAAAGVDVRNQPPGGSAYATVRQAVFSDLEELAELFDQHRVFHGQASDLSAGRSFLRARFDHGESVLFIAHVNTTPLGFAQLYPSFSSTALARVFILNDLFVHQTGRRKGVASQLLAAVEAYAWSHGAARVTLNVVRDNQPGQALYEAQGWRKDAQFFMYHRFPANG